MKARQKTSESGRMPILPIVDLQVGNYVVEKKKYIGRGQYGIVYSCYDIKNKEKALCAKQISKKEVDPILLKREIEILKLLKPLQKENENLVELVDVLEDKDNQHLYIIMEKCNQGDLKGLMDSREKKNTWFKVSEAVEIVKQIVKGYEALFKMKVIHRDLKPANILINNDIYKIADLGMGRILEDMALQQNITKVGTPAYAAPQLFLEPLFSSKADVYSLGVIFFQLIYDELPINAQSQAELIEKLRKLKTSPIKCPAQSSLRENVPQDIQQLLEKMLSGEEETRASWMDLFASPVFSLNIALPKRTNPKKYTLATQNLGAYQEYYRVDEIQISTKQDKILHIIKVLITKSDLSAKTYKALQEQKFLPNKIKFENEQMAALQVCLSGYRYRTIQNALGLLINQPATIIQEFKSRFSQSELQEFSQNNQNDLIKILKEYITKILNQTILQFREDECVFLNNLKKVDNQDFKALKALLEEEDNPEFSPFSKLFRKIYTSALSYINWNRTDQKNKELIHYFEKVGAMDLNFNVDQLYQTKPTDILQKSQKISQ